MATQSHPYPELPERLSPVTADELGGLFSPFRIRNTVLANRFVMPGMQRGWCKDGRPLPELAAYYQRRVEGGVSLVIGESSAVDHPSAQAQPSAARLTRHTIADWARCAEAVRGAGGHMLFQLWHEGGGRQNGDGLTLSPAGFGRPGEPNGSAATVAQLHEIRDAFVESALLAESVGASGIEVHAAHGYFLDQLLWQRTNPREDAYGGVDIGNRARLHSEIISAIRSACGPSFIISVRFSQWKESDYSARIANTPEELGELLRIFAAAGVDLLHVSTRRFWVPEWDGSDLGLAGWSKKLSGIPTVTVGSIGLDKDVMDSLLTDVEVRPSVTASLHELARRFAAGEFDLVSVGRSLIADPDWVQKVSTGELTKIRTFRKSDIESLRWE